MSKTGAAFSVRFLRNGDQVVIVRNIINQKGSGLALFQVVEPNTGVVTPNWDATGKTGEELNAILDAQPIIQLGVRSSYGYSAEIKSVTWYYNKALKFNLRGPEWVTAEADAQNLDAQKFQARIDGTNFQLKIIGNLASRTVVANRQISYDVEYACNGMTDKVQGSVDVLIQAAGSDSHLLQITTTRVELDAENPSAELTAVGMYGTKYVTIGKDNYTIKWFQDGKELTEQTSAKLVVNRDKVTGGSIFVAKLFLGESAVAQDSQRINDTADEYQIMATPTNAGANWIGVNHNATYNLSVTKNGKDYAGGNVTYTWDVYNAIGDKQLPDPTSTSTGTGSLVTVTPDYAKVGTGDKAYYADCDVQVTAEIL